MIRHRFVLAIIAASCVAGCAGGPAPSGSPDETLRVVATFSILGDFVQNVGGDRVEVKTLVGAGRDAHEFQPSPADATAVAEAAAIFENGLGFETWLDDLVASSGSQALRVVATDGIEPRQGGHGSESERGDLDPHVWHNVANAIQMIRNVSEALATADPANTQTYRANAEAYVAELQELDEWIVSEVSRLPADRRKLVTSHDTFGFFAERYGLEVIGSALGTSTELADPSAGAIASLIEEIRAAGVPVIFAENVSGSRLIEQIAAEAGVKLGPALYTDALGAPGSEGDTYLKMMRFNVQTIVKALSP